MTPPRISPSRFARLHNEGVNRVSDELSFEQPEKASVLDRRERKRPTDRQYANAAYFWLARSVRGAWK